MLFVTISDSPLHSAPSCPCVKLREFETPPTPSETEPQKNQALQNDSDEVVEKMGSCWGGIRVRDPDRCVHNLRFSCAG